MAQTYQPKTFDLSGLNGISDQTLEIHFKLYEGYVKATNELNERIAEISAKGAMPAEKVSTFSELKRRLGFEYNGMVLHEYYFENMMKQGGGDPDKGSAFRTAVEKTYESYDAWKAEFAAVGTMRGIGWAICYQDNSTGALSNHWVTLHEEGNVAGYRPIIVMDVWEHAFLLDYKPADRPKYIEAFFSNLDWGVIEGRLAQ